MRSTFSLLIALAVAGCAPMAYQKAGMTATQASAEEQDCRSLAAREAPVGPWMPGRFYGWRGRPYPFGSFADPMLSRLQAESDLADFCMRARGYEMKPLANPS